MVSSVKNLRQTPVMRFLAKYIMLAVSGLKRLGQTPVMRFLAKNIMLVVLVLLCVILSILSPHFLTFRNLMNIVLQSAPLGIVAIGMTYVIITGGIDLSVGSVLAFSSAVGASLMSADFPIVPSILIMLCVSTGFGFSQGLLISRLRLPAFIATLGGMSIGRGMTMVFMQGRTISGMPSEFRFIGNGHFFEVIPVAVVIMAVVFLIAFYILKYTAYGRSVYALGGNREATRLSGINTKNVEAVAYGISGLTAGLGAAVLLARIGTALPTGGEGLELDVIGAVVIGGASLSGGRGTIFGTLIGVLVLGVLSNALNLLNVDPFASGIVRGAVILIAVLIDTFKKS